MLQFMMSQRVDMTEQLNSTEPLYLTFLFVPCQIEDLMVCFLFQLIGKIIMGNIYRARTMSQALLLALTILTYLILIVIFEVDTFNIPIL